MSSATPAPRRRSAAPWLFGLAAVLAVLAPFLFGIVWIVDGTMAGFVWAAVIALLDLFAALLAALAGTVVAARRGIVRVRTAVTGHPQGRAGRLAEHQAARVHLARDRFAVLRSEWAAFESDRGAVARRPALTDVSVPATARFVDAFARAERLLDEVESGVDGTAAQRRGEFVAAVDEAVAAWHEAQRVADAAGVEGPRAEPATPTTPIADPITTPVAAPGTTPTAPRRDTAPEYAEVADAVRKAARRGMDDIKSRLRA